MSFSADWLALRAEADREARDPGLAAELAGFWEDQESLTVLDLGAGTGASLHAISPLLPRLQHWTLIDADAGLLDLVEVPDGVDAQREVFDLSGDLAALFDPAPGLVTASAFFDLCGEAWIGRLVDAVARADAVFYTALTYDGRETWAPAHATDNVVLAAFHADQRRDKGLGPALGPEATEALVRAFREQGYHVVTAQSDWNLTSRENADLIRMLAEGSAGAVRPALGETADAWLEARRTAEAVIIGHLDLLAVPKSRIADS